MRCSKVSGVVLVESLVAVMILAIAMVSINQLVFYKLRRVKLSSAKLYAMHLLKDSLSQKIFVSPKHLDQIKNKKENEIKISITNTGISENSELKPVQGILEFVRCSLEKDDEKYQMFALVPVEDKNEK